MQKSKSIENFWCFVLTLLDKEVAKVVKIPLVEVMNRYDSNVPTVLMKKVMLLAPCIPSS
jgi:hypothetical protein